MKKTTVLILVSVFLTANLFAQFSKVELVKENKGVKSYKLDPQVLLKKENEKVDKFLQENPGYWEQQKLSKKAAWNFSVGSTKSWYSHDFTTETYKLVPSTCRAVGTNCYIFVEDAIWNSRVTLDNVNAVKNAFDNSTPIDANRGIYDITTSTFGNPPDVDGDSKIIIFIQDIKDGYDGSGGYIAGYFNSLNQVTYTNSNKAEIYYLDADPANLSTTAGLENVMSTTAHEFQHMIHFNYHNGTPTKPGQLTFMNEGCSLVSEVVCGYPIYNQSLFNSEYNHYLFDWRDLSDNSDVLNDYSRAARYFTYMYEQFGEDFLTKFVQSKLVGLSGINDALSKLNNSTTLRFPETLENWFIANAVNNTSTDSKWGYTTNNIDAVNSLNIYNPNYTSGEITVERGAADYISFVNGSNLSINFNNYNTSVLNFKAVIFRSNGNIEVTDLNPNTDYAYSEFGSSIDKITFVIYNTNTTNKYKYECNSTGDATTVELAYDKNVPTGVLGLTSNDTVCVVFDGISNAKLDSIKVALRQAGSVYGGIYQYTGSSRPTPLGKKLKSLTVTSNIAQKPPYPYPDPYTNWVNVDLTSDNIDISKPFVAAFVVEGTYPEKNRIMVTEQEKAGNHSFTYLNKPSSGEAAWYYLSSNNAGDSVFAYLIRAYASARPTDIDENGNEEISTEYSLSQNYPNPFNPVTTINYAIPVNVKGHAPNVILSVYDVLGREVVTLVNKNQNAGKYQVKFNASNLPSGIYFYKLQAGNFVATKKMILMK